MSPRGFAMTNKRGSESGPHTMRNSIITDGFRSTQQTFHMETEPYEDPKLDPDFVRSTKSYLKEANLINVKREILRE